MRRVLGGSDLARLVAGCFLTLAVFAGTPSLNAEAGPSGKVAAYRGPDREETLVEGAKREGRLVIYTVNPNVNSREAVINGFSQKYPFIEVTFYRADTAGLTTRVLQEYRARRYEFDVIEMNEPQPSVLAGSGILTPFYSPNLRLVKESLVKWANGDLAYAVTVAATPASIGYNTNLVPPGRAPREWDDLLDPLFRDRMVIPSSSTGVHWVGAAIHARGESWIRQLGTQRPHLVSGSGRAIADRVANGEYALTPAYFQTFYFDAVRRGQPVAWVPLEPMYAIAYKWGIPVQSQHPHAAMLFLDFVMSMEGQKSYTQFEGYYGTLKGAGSLLERFDIFEADVPDYTDQYQKWEQILQFITTR